MNGRRNRPSTALLPLAVGLAVSPAALRAQSPPTWSDYDLVQFITVERWAPATILDLDDNGTLALRAENGIEEGEFRERTGANESQIRLLEAWRLLERSGDTLRTAFPVLDVEETRALRSWTESLAESLADKIEPDALALHRELEASGRAGTAYAILFSYVLDGLTWDIWEEGGQIEEREVSLERPFWDGHVWAVTPERFDLVGTNKISDDRGALVVTWSHAAIPSMVPFVTDWPAVEALFEAFVDDRQVGDRAREVFAPYGLFDDSGGLTIPVVDSRGSDPLHIRGQRIAETLAVAVPEALDLAFLRGRFGFRSESQALVVGYHELMWDVLDALVERGVVERPAVLDGRAAGRPEVGALVFGVR